LDLSNFSERQGLSPTKIVQVNEIDKKLRIRVLNLINRQFEIVYNDDSDSYIYLCKQIVSDHFVSEISDDINQAKKYIRQCCHNGIWYEVYDLLEYAYKMFIDYFKLMLADLPESAETYGLIDELDKENNEYYETRINEIEVDIDYILECEKSAYRMINGNLVPITNELEVASISEAASTKYKSVNKHIEKSISLYSDRINPDYKNSIKESISAVEAISKIITNKDNKTLAPALDMLEKNGVRIHKALKDGFKNLYGFTSDESGIRHAKIDFSVSPEEDARYMLISCSAFVNYLIVKNNKVNDKI